jgi:hypothetical protein
VELRKTSGVAVFKIISCS